MISGTNLSGRWEYLLFGHTTIAATELFYNRRLIPNESPESGDCGIDGHACRRQMCSQILWGFSTVLQLLNGLSSSERRNN
jgi:hypothetical protein